jgi:hypothetical protein
MNTTANTTRIRWWIAGLMWLAIAINYIDRTVLSAAAPHLIDELKLDPEMMGFIMAAFFGHTRYYRSPPGGSPIVLVRKRSWFSRRLVVNCHLDDGCCHGF